MGDDNMTEKELKVTFSAPLNELDTEKQTYGCRANNSDICANNSVKESELLLQMIVSAVNLQEYGKSSISS